MEICLASFGTHIAYNSNHTIKLQNVIVFRTDRCHITNQMPFLVAMTLVMPKSHN